MLSAGAERSPRTEWRSCCEAADAAGTRGATARHRRAALSPPAPVPRAVARRQMQQGPSPSLGAQPFLLPGDDPGEGREPDRALRGPRAAPRMAPPRLRRLLAGLLPATRFAVE